MKRYYGGQRVKGGAYVSLATGEFVPMSGEGGVLPGGQPARYVRLPLGVAAALGPLVGLAYIIFLPLVGFLTVLWVAGRLLRQGLAALVLGTLPAFFPSWKPGFAFFQRQARRPRQRKEQPGNQEAEVKDKALDELAQEVEAQRKGGK